MQIFSLKSKPEYARQIAILTQNEWGHKCSTKEEFEQKIDKKVSKMLSSLERVDYAKLLLLERDNLVGFISIFPTDGEERCDLTPWYATMYVVKEYRKKGYSKILNDAILKEAKERGFSKIYLKTDLVNYYEKFGFIYMEDLKNGEKLYFKEI